MCIIFQTFNISDIWYRHSYIDQAIFKKICCCCLITMRFVMEFDNWIFAVVLGQGSTMIKIDKFYINIFGNQRVEW